MLAVSSVLNALYYLPALIAVWSGKPEPEARTEKDPCAHAAILLFMAGVLFLGICFSPVMDLIVRGLELL